MAPMDELQRWINSAKKRPPNVTTLARINGNVFGMSWVNGRMEVRLLRKAA